MSKSVQCRKPDSAQEAVAMLGQLVAEHDESQRREGKGVDWMRDRINYLFTEDSKVGPSSEVGIDKAAYEAVMVFQAILHHMLNQELERRKCLDGAVAL